MRIFITGSTGLVGSNLVDYYSQETVIPFHRANLTKELDSAKPDVIIHCAAELVDESKMWESNVLLAVECLDWLRNNPRTRMIQIGSSAEYGALPYPSREIDRINPPDIYTATKGSATLMCQGYARRYGLDICIARPFSVYGKYEKPHRLFPRLWKAFFRNRPMKLFDGYHDFIHVNDFVRGIDTLVRKPSILPGDIINFGSGHQHRNIEVLDAFARVTGMDAPVEIMHTMAKRYESNNWVCDTTYARDAYGFLCQYDLESGVKEFISSAEYD